MITADTVMFADVVQQSTCVWSSVSPREQSGNYKNHVSARVTKISIFLFTTITDEIHYNYKIIACSHWRHVINDSLWGDGMIACKTLLDSLFSLHLSGSMFILLQELQ